jgi:hypothetical protein
LESFVVVKSLRFLIFGADPNQEKKEREKEKEMKPKEKNEILEERRNTTKAQRQFIGTRCICISFKQNTQFKR